MPYKKPLFTTLLITIITVGIGCESVDEPQVDGWRGEKTNIAGGAETNFESWKGVIALYNDAGAICTASFLSTDVLLTAGHCVYLPSEGINAVNNTSSLKVWGGADITGFSKRFYPNIEQVIIHPQWKGNINSLSAVDLALAKLTKPAKISETYSLRQQPAVSSGQSGKIVGYGLENSVDQLSAGVHRVGDTTIQSVRARVIELRSPTSTCQGDSGGPLFTEQDGEWVITAITSFGFNQRCGPNLSGFSMNVLTYRDWIASSFKELTGRELGTEPPTEEEEDTSVTEQPNTDDASEDTDLNTGTDQLDLPETADAGSSGDKSSSSCSHSRLGAFGTSLVFLLVSLF